MIKKEKCSKGVFFFFFFFLNINLTESLHLHECLMNIVFIRMMLINAVRNTWERYIGCHIAASTLFYSDIFILQHPG